MADFYSDASAATLVYDEEMSEEASVRGDVDFYRTLAMEAPGPTLELGTGTGRIVCPLAATGVEAVGMDRSQSMLAIARSKLCQLPDEVRARLSFETGEMASFELGRTFGLVIVACSTFQLLLTSDDQRTCLAAIRRHLVPGGRVVIHVADPILTQLTPGAFGVDPERQRRGSNFGTPSGGRIERALRFRLNDTVNQRYEEAWHFRELDAQGRVVRDEDETLRMRWIYRNEMRYLLELSGFEVESEYSDFFGSAPAYGKQQIWVARRSS